MAASHHVISPDRLWAAAGPLDAPLALVDLDADQPWPQDIALPACPVIGIGSPDHPRAAALDAVVEPPVSLSSMVTAITRQPQAAAVFVALMRMHAGAGMPDEAMLDAESLGYAALQASAGHRAWLTGRPASETAPPGRVRAERTDETLHLVLDRPLAGNAVDREMRDALYAAFGLAAAGSDVARIVLRAEGKAFSLGADLAEFGTTTDAATAHAIRARTLPARALSRFRGLLDVHVHGACVGAGLEIAAFGSWITATSSAWFQLPELAMGIVPGAGGCLSVPRRIGRQRTALLLLSGRRISARTARDWGLIDAIADHPA